MSQLVKGDITDYDYYKQVMVICGLTLEKYLPHLTSMSSTHLIIKTLCAYITRIRYY